MRIKHQEELTELHKKRGEVQKALFLQGLLRRGRETITDLKLYSNLV